MKRRTFLAAGCAWCAATLPRQALAQSAPWTPPARFARPDIASDEGGLWALMDREETKLRRSRFVLRDPQLHDYVQDIVCRLAGEHCPDVRVHLVHTPYFNASMAPNGMMQVWTGLMLRVDNEAQLAAVLGHEIGHYMARHSIEQLREAKSRSGVASFMALFGVAGLVGQMGLVASMYSYTRDHEREADRIGAVLMRKAGYDVGEAAKVWENLLLELKARGDDAEKTSPLFATHPPAAERQDALAALAKELPGGVTNGAAWIAHIKPYLREWLDDEVKRGQHEESLALLTRLMVRSPEEPEYAFARGEGHRLRAKNDDLDAAVADYQVAVKLGGEPPEVYRGLGNIYRLRAKAAEAKASFQHYLDLAPNAPDAPMIKSYLEELHT